MTSTEAWLHAAVIAGWIYLWGQYVIFPYLRARAAKAKGIQRDEEGLKSQ